MKKSEYMAPKAEIVELEMSNCLLTISDGGGTIWGGDAGDGDDDNPA